MSELIQMFGIRTQLYPFFIFFFFPFQKDVVYVLKDEVPTEQLLGKDLSDPT